MTVIITDPAHPHFNELGVLISKQTVQSGRVLTVELNECSHGDQDCPVAKHQIALKEII